MPSPSILRHHKTWVACLLARWRLSKRLLPLINQAAAGYYASRDGDTERWRGGDMERAEG